MLQVEEVSIGWHTQRRADGRGRMNKGSQMRCTIGTSQQKERGGLPERVTLSAKSCLPQSHPQQEDHCNQRPFHLFTMYSFNVNCVPGLVPGFHSCHHHHHHQQHHPSKVYIIQTNPWQKGIFNAGGNISSLTTLKAKLPL